jgi:NAD+ synthase
LNELSALYEEEVINFDRDKEVASICDTMRKSLLNVLHRRGVVVAVSGGIDSSVCAALSVAAFGPKKTFLIKLPEQDSAEITQSRSSELITHLGVDYTTHDIAPVLEAIGCYKYRDEAIQELFPEYTPDWKCKIVIRGGITGKINHFVLIVQDPTGSMHEKRLDLKAYLQIVAATNYKQRIRKTIEYFHADRLNFAVIGTPNRLEYDQGFFVKNGDGSADIKPIAHLYKNQVYALARHLGLPESLCNAEPSTDTYSLSQGQDEFYFALPHQQMDKALWAYNRSASKSELAEFLGITEEESGFIMADIANKRRTTQYLHRRPILMEDVNLS